MGTEQGHGRLQRGAYARQAAQVQHAAQARTSRSVTGGRHVRPVVLFLGFVITAFLAFLGLLTGDAGLLMAQEATGALIAPGDAVVSGFSGTMMRAGKPFIDPTGTVLRVFALGNPGQPRGQLISPATRLEIPAGRIGQVFGIALDNADPPNIYAAASSVYGLHIVAPDADGDGIREVVTTGQPGATFMEGLFGPGGGPGAVWKIDGRTGQAGLLVNIENSGPGLGNVVFDPTHYQLFVSDLDTGFIWRVDLQGNLLGAYDHGRDGRPAAGLDAVEDDGVTADITSPAFDSTNPDTWGFTDVRRRIWGLAYYKGRLYYAVEAGPQIWSVGIDKSGGFQRDARIEISQVPGGFPVTDILFSPEGEMILAQRGGVMGDAAFQTFHVAGANRVLRYRKDENGNWVLPGDEYAIGFAGSHRNATGGVGLSCSGLLWATGDNLRNDPQQAASLSEGGALEVHGLQGMRKNLVRPRNVPPWAALYVDFDGQTGDPGKAGHVGDVEIYRYCLDDQGQYDRGESWPGWTPETDWTPPQGWAPPPWWPQSPDLQLDKADTQCSVDPANPMDQLCTFTITITNVSGVPYTGPLSVRDTVPVNVQLVQPPAGSIGWACTQPGGIGGPISCTSLANQTLLPGASVTLVLTLRRIAPFPGFTVRNCAMSTTPGDPPGNNSDCGWAFPPGPDLEMVKTLRACVPVVGGSICNYWLDVVNVGNAPLTSVLHVTDTLPPGAFLIQLPTASNAGWACLDNGGVVDCWLGPVTLPPGASEWVEISIFVPDTAPPGSMNCARLGAPEHVNDPDINGNNAQCAPVLPAMAGPLLFAPNQPRCPAGWTPETPDWQPPEGWERKVVKNGDASIVCGRRKQARGEQPPPPPPASRPPAHKPPASRPHKPRPPATRPPRHRPSSYNCPRGWWRYPDQALVPAGWETQVITLPEGKGRLICARPHMVPPVIVVPPVGDHHPPAVHPPQHGPTTGGCEAGKPCGGSASGQGVAVSPGEPDHEGGGCAPGEGMFTSPADVPPGWTVRPVRIQGRTVWCARKKVGTAALGCGKGEQSFADRDEVPPGWQVRVVSRDGQEIYCARPTGRGPVVHCPKGMRRFASRENVPDGWKARRMTVNGETYWCASAGTEKTVSKPRQKRRKVRRGCPRGTRLIRGKCRRIVKKRRVRRRKVRRRRHCPPGTIPGRYGCVPIGAILGPIINSIPRGGGGHHHPHGGCSGC